MSVPVRATSGMRLLLRRYVLPHWPWAVGLLVLLAATTAVQLAQPRLLAAFIDRAARGSPLHTLTRVGIAFLVVAVAGQVVDVVEAYAAERLALATTNELRGDLTLQVLRLDMAFHHDHRPGELIQRVDGDVVSLGNLFSRFVVTLAGSALLLVGVLAMIWMVDVRLGAGMTAFCVVVLVILYRLRFTGRGLWQHAMQANADQFGFIEEHLAGTEDIRSSGAVPLVLRRFWQHARDVLRWTGRAMLVGHFTSHVAYISFGLGGTAALAAAAWMFTQGTVTIGTVFLVHQYAWRLFSPVFQMNRQVQNLQEAAAAVGRIGELLQMQPSIADSAGDELPNGPLRVELDDVVFGYDENTPVLKDVSLTLEPGRVLGVLGRTGSGKTTLGRLLARLYDPQSGSIAVGGVDLRRATLSGVRTRIGVVGQDVRLFEGTVRDNLTFFDPSVDDARARDALRSLGIDRDLDAPVASGGAGMSAGEAQLLAFARVFLRHPGLVILDEATSRLDPATEQRLEQATRRLFEGRTAVVIAHRLRTVMSADEILILQDGRIVEHGARAGLQADPESRFSRLLRAGIQGVLVDDAEDALAGSREAGIV